MRWFGGCEPTCQGGFSRPDFLCTPDKIRTFAYSMERRTLLHKISSALEPLYDRREASAIARLVVEQLCGLSRVDFTLEPQAETAWTPALEDALRQLTAGRPVQYVLGKTLFCGLPMNVREGVLIPRPETEELVEWIVSEQTAAGVRVLDVGTGSGCIAVALAHRLAAARVTALDVSETALAIAAGNAAQNQVEVHFLQADVLTPIDTWGLDYEFPERGFDLIVSNPPYVPASDRESMQVNVRDYEPAGALFVPDDDPLLFYRAIAGHARRLLRPGGTLWFECYERLAEPLAVWLSERGFVEVQIRQDMNGKNRMVRCRKE